MLPDKIKRMEPDSFDNLVYPDRANELIDIINSIRNLEVINGKVIWTDKKVTIAISGSIGAAGTSGSGGTTNILGGDLWL